MLRANQTLACEQAGLRAMRSIIILQPEFLANHRCQRRIDCELGDNAPQPPETDPTAYCDSFTLYEIARK